MRRRGRVVLVSALVALTGVAVVFASIAWYLWRASEASSEAYAGGLAASLGKPSEQIILDTHNMLAALDRLEVPRCSKEHLRALRDAAIARPHIRAIGYWKVTERQCGVGFMPQAGLKPPRADRIYDSGVIAWWPGPNTEVGGVPMFLMRFGDHDAAIDPRLLLDIGPGRGRQAVLWVEKLRMVAVPPDATLPAPDSLAVGATVDGARGMVISRYSRNELLPIDVVAMEPFDDFLERHSQVLAAGALLGMLLVAAWIYAILRYSRHQLSSATELRQALAEGRIQVRYQPVIDLVSGRCIGSEALARWERESGEQVPPDVFIPIAEDSGLVQGVTIAVLRTALRDLRELLLEFPGTSVNLNLSPDDLRNDRIGAELAAGLAAAGLPAAAVKLEITERALINNEAARARIRGFRSRGHAVAVDDFGTGYSSLSYLQSFELDVLKIDKSFVDAIGTEAATSQVIVHVIEMAKSLGLDTVAEGVETRDQMQWLVAHGVTFGQGYLFSRPLGAAEFIEFCGTSQRRIAA